jgi:exopolysaccharide biosynthesis polyprenyl glycosylphosphotransferase
MVLQRARGIHTFTLIGQMILAMVLFWCYASLLQIYYSDDFFWALDRYRLYSLCVVLGLIIESATHTHKNGISSQDLLSIHRKSFRQVMFVAATLLFFLVAAKDKTISRVFLFSYLLMLYPLLATLNFTLPARLARRIFNNKLVERTVLVGPAAKAAGMKNWLERKSQFGLEVVGVLSDQLPPSVQSDFPILGSPEELHLLIQEHNITQVIVTEFPMFPKALTYYADACERLGVRLYVVTDFEDKFRHPIRFFQNDEFHFIGLREEPLENPFNRALKRALDVAVALPVVVFILPLTTLLVWFIQRLQSPGPVFYKQSRAGLQNRPFDIWKYRTMHLDNPDVNRQATQRDNRIYPSGQWLRKMSIDELPQFINVLSGQMSVVGPRPHLPEHNDYFANIMSNYHIRSFVKPGITGLAQVRGFRGETKNEEDVIRRVESDIHYLENWSIAMDVWLIVRTCWEIVYPPKSAY